MKSVSNIKDKESFQALVAYLTAPDHYCNFQSNFQATIAVVSNINSGESMYMMTTHKITDSDWPYHFRHFEHIDQIRKMKKARKTLQQLNKKDRDFLLLAFYNSPGRFSPTVKKTASINYYYNLVDLSACLCLVGNMTIPEVEKLTNDNLSKLVELTKNEFHNSLKAYTFYYNNNEENLWE
jgi:hypothetical protein